MNERMNEWMGFDYYQCVRMFFCFGVNTVHWDPFSFKKGNNCTIDCVKWDMCLCERTKLALHVCIRIDVCLSHLVKYFAIDTKNHIKWNQYDCDCSSTPPPHSQCSSTTLEYSIQNWRYDPIFVTTARNATD